MKKIYKLIFLLVVVLGILAISTTFVYAEETIPDVVEQQPSELAKWIQENVVEVVVATITAIVGIIIAYLRFSSIIKKALDLFKKEKKEVNDIQTNASNELAKINKQLLALTNELVAVRQELKETKEASLLANNTFKELKNEQITTKEMLRVGFSNDKELVRLGIAEEINKIAKKGV